MGGADVDPRSYGEAPGPRTYGVQPEQDAFETALLRAALAEARPVLAVCRGMQLTNVVLGGTLVQHLGDLPTAASLLRHAPAQFPVGEEFALHEIVLESDSAMARAAGTTRLEGASFHHQGIGRLADDLRPVGTAPDGLLEAVEHRTHWLLGMQWHPEDTAERDPAQQRIYDAFVSRARESASTR
jgi:putative glutamine amidotransferase